MRDRPRYVTIDDVRYEIVWKAPPKAMGTCDAPWKRGLKEIWIDPRLTGKKLMDAIIHETAHAANWNIEEHYIAEAATAAASILWRMGYRLK